MSLRYVTRKLESQSLKERGEGEGVKEELPIYQDPIEKEDSGSESDDEEEEENIQPMENISNSCVRVLRLRNVERETEIRTGASSKFVSSPVPLCDDNYSSEEELKEIINCDRQRKKSGTSLNGKGNEKKSEIVELEPGNIRATKSSLSSRSSTGSSVEIGEKILPGIQFQSGPAEKRKWSEMSGCDLCASDPDRASSSCSCDEDESFEPCAVASYELSLEAANASPTTPVQFCTSPPVDVHKPRQHSASPPAKLFHMSTSADSSGRVTTSGFQRLESGILRQTSAQEVGSVKSQDIEDDVICPDTDEIFRSSRGGQHHRHNPSSPNKRHRLTPRPQNMQRPCLDFEKMQQIKKRVVTSWRPQGTELSLFCW